MRNSKKNPVQDSIPVGSITARCGQTENRIHYLPQTSFTGGKNPVKMLKFRKNPVTWSGANYGRGEEGIRKW